MPEHSTPAQKPCPVCGVAFVRASSRLRRQTTCSPACRVARRNSLEVVSARFWPLVAKGTACWLWQGRTQGNNGYGSFHHRGRHLGSHVFSWILHRGPVPDGLCVLHTCDVPLCVNPAHLFLGTPADNARDRDAKGRGARGERVGAAKLTPAQVGEMRRLRATGLSTTRLGVLFGIDRSTAWRVVTGELWPHLPQEG